MASEMLDLSVSCSRLAKVSGVAKDMIEECADVINASSSEIVR